MSFLDQNSSEKRRFFAPSILQSGSNFAFYQLCSSVFKTMLKFPADFPPSHEHWQTAKHWVRVLSIYGLECFHIWSWLLFGKFAPFYQCVVFFSWPGVMELTVEEVRGKIKEKYSEEVAKKFEGEISWFFFLIFGEKRKNGIRQAISSAGINSDFLS